MKLNTYTFKSMSSTKHAAFAERIEHGAILAEFMLVAPIMLLIAGSALRFYQELQAHELAITFVREVSTLTYSRCLDRTVTRIERLGDTDQDQLIGDETKTLEAIGDCIKGDIIPQFVTSWKIASPTAYKGNFTIKVDAYRCDITQISSISCATVGKVSCTSTNGCDEQTTNASQPRLLNSARNRLVTARISFTIAPLSSFIPSIAPQTIAYDATV